ncbi:MAG: hypothetical protein ACRDFB_01325 [Rhabdochlamydiaceae bacterium]
MKNLHLSIIAILLILVLPSSQYLVYAPLIIPPTDQLFNESAIIVVGNIISASEIQNDTRTEYVIHPQEYLKPSSSNMTQSIIAYGVGSKNFNPYAKIYQVGDRVLFFLQEKNYTYLIMPYSIWTKSDCNGKQLLALNYSPGDFSITQENNTIDNMVTGKPINITGYAHNSSDLKPRDIEMDFTVHNAQTNLTLTGKKQAHIDECKGFAQSSYVFVPTMPGRYSVSVDSYDSSGEHGGGSLCCITVSGKNGSSAESNTNQVTPNQTVHQPQQSWCVGCIPADKLQLNGILVPAIGAAAVVGFWLFLFRRFKDD